MALAQIPIKKIMTSPVITVMEASPFSEVAEVFAQNHIRHLPVVDESGSLIGLMSKRDLYHTVAPRKGIEESLQYFRDKISEPSGDFYMKDSLDRFILEQIMVKDVACLKENNSLKEALQMIVTKRIGCVVIVDEDRKVRGIVTRYDILKYVDEAAL